jgi:hypothetical protein
MMRAIYDEGDNDGDDEMTMMTMMRIDNMGVMMRIDNGDEGDEESPVVNNNQPPSSHHV